MRILPTSLLVTALAAFAASVAVAARAFVAPAVEPGLARERAGESAARVPPREADAPGDVIVREDLQYAEGIANEPRRNRLDLYLPARASGAAGGGAAPLVMFVHGGVWTGGGKERGTALARGLAARGIACASINTQLFPFAAPDDMVGDCGRALAWLRAHAGEHGIDGDRLFVMGHSAGGHLIAWLALDERRLAAAGVPRAALRGAIALSGVFEVRARHPFLDQVFRGGAAVRRDASPLVHAGAGDPPMLLWWADRDLPGLALCGRMLRDRLRAAGVPVVAREWAGTDHNVYFRQLGQPGDTRLDAIAAFVLAPPAVAEPLPPRAEVAAPVAVALGGRGAAAVEDEPRRVPAARGASGGDGAQRPNGASGTADDRGASGANDASGTADDRGANGASGASNGNGANGANSASDGNALPTPATSAVCIAPAGPTVAALLWVHADAGERADGEALARALAPFGLATWLVAANDPLGCGPAVVAATWRALHQPTTAAAARPAFVGGRGLGALAAALAPLATADGLRGRVLVGAPLGPASLATAAPGAVMPDVAAALATGGRAAPSVLLLCGGDDGKVLHTDARAVVALLAQRGVDQHLIELPGATTAALLRGAGTDDDLVLPLLRAFVLP